MLLKISQNSQENTCASLGNFTLVNCYSFMYANDFFNSLGLQCIVSEFKTNKEMYNKTRHVLRTCAIVYVFEFCEISKNTFLTEHT